MKMKYVIMDYLGLDTPFLFPEWVDYSHVCNNRDLAIGAGFCSIDGTGKRIDVGYCIKNDFEVFCHGKSVTLGKESRGEEDAKLIRKMLLES